MALAKQTIEIFSFFVLNLDFGPYCILASKDADIPKLDISSLWQLILQICISCPELKPLWGDAKKKETRRNLFKPGVKLPSWTWWEIKGKLKNFEIIGHILLNFSNQLIENMFSVTGLQFWKLKGGGSCLLSKWVLLLAKAFWLPSFFLGAATPLLWVVRGDQYSQSAWSTGCCGVWMLSAPAPRSRIRISSAVLGW